MAAPSNLVAAGKVVSIHYTLTDDAGAMLDSSEGRAPLAYLHGAGNIVPGLESGIAGKAIGDRFKVDVAPEEGYGVRDPKGMDRVPRDAFPPDIELEPGMQFSAENERGDVVTTWIHSIEGDQVTIDLNHPLAGKTLHFQITVASIRDATREEMTHGHPHGPGGHHH
jgi:FKBP-type peptidyl-prolyl cis-trans isomerase SlyD